MSAPNVILKSEDLRTWFPIRRGLLRRVAGHVRAVEEVSFELHEGETLGLVGESGCGKSTLVQTLLRLIEQTSGRISYFSAGKEHDLGTMTHSDLKPLRRELQLVFQDPSASMNPGMTVEEIITEPLRIHGIGSALDRRRKAAEMLAAVGLDPGLASRFPGSFSGGQKQRIGIARALVLDPRVLILDEPVSALDVSVQSQILNLLKDIKKRRRLTYLFIAHNLDVVRYMSDRIMVMYLGRIVESAPAETLYRSPRHPYTQALLNSVPIVHPRLRGTGELKLEGDVPDPADPPPGCAFHTRCPFAVDVCREKVPALLSQNADDHLAACHLSAELTLEGRRA